MPLTHAKRIPALDGLRGLAILLVLLYHTYPRHRYDPISLLSDFGWLGMDLFFVLSGFLITGVLFDTLKDPHFFRNFFARRALRILPAYVVFCGAAFIYCLFRGERPTVWALPYLLFLSNIVADLHLPIGIGYHLSFGHLWSLAVEEQFYLVWPIILYMLARTRPILYACIAGIVLAFFLRCFSTPHLPHFNQATFLLTRLDAFLSGGLLAILARRTSFDRRCPNAILYAAMLSGLALIGIAAFAQHSTLIDTPMLRYGLIGAAILFSATVALALRSGTLVSTVGSLAPLRTLGRYSYAIYLIHGFPLHQLSAIMATAGRRLPVVGSLLVFLGYGSLCFAIAVWSDRVIEQPFLKRKQAFTYADEQQRTVALVS